MWDRQTAGKTDKFTQELQDVVRVRLPSTGSVNREGYDKSLLKMF